jgi:hypothetical protein
MNHETATSSAAFRCTLSMSLILQPDDWLDFELLLLPFEERSRTATVVDMKNDEALRQKSKTRN